MSSLDDQPAGAPLAIGILAAGGIAARLADACTLIPEIARVVAVGSRRQDTAAAFAARCGIPVAHGSYEALVADPAVELVYVASPHPFHLPNALLALAAGKHVLVEKPIAMDAAQARTLATAARRAGRFGMEAMWSRFLPSQVELRRLLAAGVVGEVRQVSADFGFRGPGDPRSRLLDPALGGGALLDVGIYVASFASLVFGRQPEQIAAFAHLGATAVDEQTAMVLGYPGGALANLSCAVRTQTPHLAQVCGTDGRIELPGFWQGDRLTIHRPGAAPEERILPTLANGFVYELAECRRCIRQGLTESPRLPLNESVAIMETLDRIRAAIGLCYPG